MTHTFKATSLKCSQCHQRTTRWFWSDDTPRCDCGATLQPTADVTGDSAAVHGDEWPGGKVFENGFREPTRFYSKQAYHAALAAKGLRVRGDGEEGSGAWISAESLRQAEALVRRCT